MKRLLAPLLAYAALAAPVHGQGYREFEGAVRVENGPIVTDPCLEMRGLTVLVRGRVDGRETYYADLDASGSIDVIVRPRPLLGDDVSIRSDGPGGTAYERGLLIGDSHLSELITERSPHVFERLERRFAQADDVYRVMLSWLAPIDLMFDGTCDPQGFFFDPLPEYLGRR